jgi:hypothetical protein
MVPWYHWYNITNWYHVVQPNRASTYLGGVVNITYHGSLGHLGDLWVLCVYLKTFNTTAKPHDS